LRIVRQHAPITGDQIAEMLQLARPTIRSDLALLVMLELVSAKPKVGYFLGSASAARNDSLARLQRTTVGEVQSIPVAVRETSTIYDAVVTLFLEDVGSLIVTDAEGRLSGILSRKDLLKVAIGGTASSMPVSLIMTRHPNVVTVTPDDSVYDAARLMIDRQVDCLPVVAPAPPSTLVNMPLVAATAPGVGEGSQGGVGSVGSVGQSGGGQGVGGAMAPEVVGRISKTTITRLLLELLAAK
jgi:CBS domain-containing protein